MVDPRVERLAELVVGYSLGLGEGKLLRLDGSDVATPLILALNRAAIRAGSHAYAHVSLDGFAEDLVAEGSDEQIAYLSSIEWHEAEEIDAMVTIWADANTRAFSQAGPARYGRYLNARRQLAIRRWERIARGELKWCGTLFPTQAHAQDAAMSLPEYERFVFGACHVLEGEDPVAHWRGTSKALHDRAQELEHVRELRFVGPDTDLTVLVEGRGWIAADGRYNMPDGEVYTSPLETSTNGEIRFSFPALFEGREVEDVRLRFEDGRVVKAEAARGQDYLESLLDMDDGARVLGEVAFGLNYEIDRFTRNILFDEKIGGTIHVALGSAFQEVGGQNESALHWDMICDLRADGEVYADGELVWRAGRFLGDPQPAVVTG